MAFITKFSLSDIQKDSRYVEADQFVKDFNPEAGIDYQWIYDYSKQTLQLARDAISDLDNKAQSMIAYLAPGSGLLGVGFVILATKSSSLQALPMVLAAIAVILLLFAMACAFSVLVPHQQTLGASIQSGIEVAGHYERDAKMALGYFASGIAVSVAELRILADCKAKHLQRSYRVFTIGALFIISAVLSSCYFFVFC